MIAPPALPFDPARPVVVTGVAGFIGFHVTLHFLDLGFKVHGIDAITDYYGVRLKEDRLNEIRGRNGFSFTKLHTADGADVETLFAEIRPELVIHLGAQAGVRYSLEAPYSYTSANIEGFLTILEGCRHHGVRHLVYASSSSVYGANTKAPFSEHDAADHPVSLYAATKRANDQPWRCRGDARRYQRVERSRVGFQPSTPLREGV